MTVTYWQVLKVWDMDDHCCVQSLPLCFPSFSVLGKTIEFGSRSLYPGPSCGVTQTFCDSGVWQRGQLLVACCDHVALLRVQVVRDRATPPPLPPPSREHHASVPSPWTAADARGLVTPDVLSSLEKPDSRYQVPFFLHFIFFSTLTFICGFFFSLAFSLRFLLGHRFSSASSPSIATHLLFLLILEFLTSFFNTFFFHLSYAFLLIILWLLHLILSFIIFITLCSFKM